MHHFMNVAVHLIHVAMVQADPFGDLSTELERELGKLVKAKYKTDFYMLYNYPLAVSAISFAC